jgi:hypothetical protein
MPSCEGGSKAPFSPEAGLQARKKTRNRPKGIEDGEGMVSFLKGDRIPDGKPGVSEANPQRPGEPYSLPFGGWIASFF